MLSRALPPMAQPPPLDCDQAEPSKIIGPQARSMKSRYPSSGNGTNQQSQFETQDMLARELPGVVDTRSLVQ
jgi:hypothetical protein